MFEISWLKSGELGDTLALKGSEETVTEEALAKCSFRLNRPGDVLIAMYGATIGKLAILAENAVTNQAVCGCTPFAGLSNRFLFLFLLANRKAFHASSEGGAQPNISKVKIVNTAFPLPPTAEQHRIVAKVDELMALCDRLEAARKTREKTRDKLTAASLARLTAPDTDPQDFPTHARFAVENLPVLTSRPDQIKTLRQTILNLAVRGKLVAQDPKDELAAELLEQFRTQKLALKATTKDRRIKLASDPVHSDYGHSLPRGWELQSFENLFLFIDYRGKTPQKTEQGVPLITAKNVRIRQLNREPREFVSQETYNKWMTRGFPNVGDIFFTTEAPLANACLNDITEPFALAQRVICLQPYAHINTRFLVDALASDVMQGLIDGEATGMTAKGIKTAKLKPLPLPIPPLAEQHRIVAKVDALMAVCDRLEAALTTADSTRTRLDEALEPAAATMEAAE